MRTNKQLRSQLNIMNTKQIITELRKHYSKKNIEGMKRFGITGGEMIGGPNIYELRKMAKTIGKNHNIAQELWDTNIHEARILAGYVDNPEEVTEKQMDEWVNDFYSWDICDQVCSNLFDQTRYGKKKMLEWMKSEKEFVRRAGFVMIACYAVHDKKAKDAEFEKYFPLIKKYSTDERNFVRKAVNWALRQTGKRNTELRKKAIKIAQELSESTNKTARWIGKDAYRELAKK